MLCPVIVGFFIGRWIGYLTLLAAKRLPNDPQPCDEMLDFDF